MREIQRRIEGIGDYITQNGQTHFGSTGLPPALSGFLGDGPIYRCSLLEPLYACSPAKAQIIQYVNSKLQPISEGAVISLVDQMSTTNWALIAILDANGVFYIPAGTCLYAIFMGDSGYWEPLVFGDCCGSSGSFNSGSGSSGSSSSGSSGSHSSSGSSSSGSSGSSGGSISSGSSSGSGSGCNCQSSAACATPDGKCAKWCEFFKCDGSGPYYYWGSDGT